MVIDPSTLRDPTNERENDPIKSKEVSTRQGNLSLPTILSDNPQTPTAQRERQLIQWRVPGLGFVQMYINPQSLKIEEKKIISKQRTKGGYVIQYWGEELPKVTLSGHTGSSGIEGINILRQVYRAEQNSFEQVAQTLSDRLNSFSSGGAISNAVNQAISGGGIGDIAGNAICSLLGNGANPPLLPTLASLAVAVELYYQGWVFKGYFDSFDVTESVQNGIGLFNYNLSLQVLDRRGIRKNNMPWHRSPAQFDDAGTPLNYNRSDSANTPLNFGGEE